MPKPIVLRDEIYAVWAAGAGVIIGLELFTGDFFLYMLFIVITSLRVLSYMKHWKLPVRTLKKDLEKPAVVISTDKKAHR